jgi:hypothetical protein
VRRAGQTRRPAQTRLAVAAGVAAVAVVTGVLVTAGQRWGSSNPGPGAGANSLAALAPDVAGRPWLARRGDDRWVWGRAGVRGRNQLPEDESGFAISGRWLASGVQATGTTHLRVRDLDTGTVVVERELDFRAAAATFAGDRLLLTGYRGGNAGQDGGIVAISRPRRRRQDPVEPGPFPARLGVRPSKGDFHLSGSGALAAVNTCGSLGCDNVVIDVAALTARIPRNGAPGFLRAITDDVLVLTDADGEWIKGIDVRTGREAFSVPDTDLMEAASMADGRVVANLGHGARGWQVARARRTRPGHLDHPAGDGTPAVGLAGGVVADDRGPRRGAVRRRPCHGRPGRNPDPGHGPRHARDRRGPAGRVMEAAMRPLFPALGSALLLAAVAAGVVTANEPVAGHDDRYPHPTNAPPITLKFQFQSAVPGWVASAVGAAWESGWSDADDKQLAHPTADGRRRRHRLLPGPERVALHRRSGLDRLQPEHARGPDGLRRLPPPAAVG